MKKSEFALVSIFSAKMMLDFLSPHRELNFLIVFSFFAIAALAKLKSIIKISKSEAIWMASFTTIIFIALIKSGDIRSFAKAGSLVLIYLVTRSILIEMPKELIERAAERILQIFIILFAINYCISVLVASPANRSFFNFEHANLLGSYILISLALFYSSKNCRKSLTTKLKIFTATLLSTSTGAMLLSALIFYRTKKINFKIVAMLIITSILATITLYFALQAYLPTYFTKIFGPVILILDGNLHALSSLAKQGIRIQDLGDQYQGSLVWRIYANYIFTSFIVNQPILSLIFGNGFHGYFAAWDGVMPHNDLILTLIDFGLLGFILILISIYKLIKYSIKRKPILIPLAAILVLRLLLENNIYSFYLVSSLTMNGLLLFHATSQRNRTKQGANTQNPV